MPGLIAHYICGLRALRAMPQEAAEAIGRHRRLYNIGCQGPDIFFYHGPASVSREVREIGARMHRTNVRSFMRNMAEGLAALQKPEREAAFAYASGYLAHYALDCAAHPFVYAKTGVLKGTEGARDKLKHLENHVSFESAIDTILLKKMAGKRPKDVDLLNLVWVNKKEAAIGADFVGKCIKKTYGVGISGHRVLSAMNYMALWTRLLQSEKGWRKKALMLAERAATGAAAVSVLIHPQKIAHEEEYQIEIFLELMAAAEIEAVKLGAILWECLENRASLTDFLTMAGDRSFITGS